MNSNQFEVKIEMIGYNKLALSFQKIPKNINVCTCKNLSIESDYNLI